MYELFPPRAPGNGTAELAEIQAHLSGVEAGDGRSAGKQAGMQAVALLVTLVFALVTGALTGTCVRCAILLFILQSEKCVLPF